jgi:Mrp family chromosome partitioning ATPase
VLLVDANLRNPSIHSLFGLPDSLGLAGCLRGECHLLEAIGTVGPLRVLPAGRDENPERLLQRAAAKDLVEQLRDTCDLVLIDLPPLTPRSDGATLCDWSDGTILVVRANATRASTVLTAVRELDRSKVLGVVLNQERQDLPRWLERLF